MCNKTKMTNIILTLNSAGLFELLSRSATQYYEQVSNNSSRCVNI